MRRILFSSLLALSLCLTPTFADHHRNESLARAQQVLKDKGYYTGTVDGQMGPLTRAAIRQYQQSENLTADGRYTRTLAERMGTYKAGDPDPADYFETAGDKLGRNYKKGGKAVAEGSKEMVGEMKEGEITQGAVDFGKGVGRGAKAIGKGTAGAAVSAGKGIKDAFDGDEDKKPKK